MLSLSIINLISHMVLVTGGTGFLGAYIINELVNKNIPVRAIRRRDYLPSFVPGEVLKQVQWMDGDVLDPVGLDEAMEGIDTIIHSAAKVSFNEHERGQMFKVNIEGTANVVNIAIEKNIRRFIHVSSVAALGRKPTVGFGIASGVAVWLASYFGWIPAARILRPASRHPDSRNALMLTAHIIWGMSYALASAELIRSGEMFKSGPLRDAV